MPCTSSSCCQAVSKFSLDTRSLSHFSIGATEHVCAGGVDGLYSEPVSKGTAWSSHPHPEPACRELLAHWWAPGQLPHGCPGHPWFLPLCSHLQTSDQKREISTECLLCVQALSHSFVQSSWQHYGISIIFFLIILFYYISIFILLLRKLRHRGIKLINNGASCEIQVSLI